MLLILIDLSFRRLEPAVWFQFSFFFLFLGGGEDSNKLQTLRVGLVVWLVE